MGLNMVTGIGHNAFKDLVPEGINFSIDGGESAEEVIKALESAMEEIEGKPLYVCNLTSNTSKHIHYWKNAKKQRVRKKHFNALLNNPITITKYTGWNIKLT